MEHHEPETMGPAPESIARRLWLRAREGDRAAFEQLFAMHVDRLLVYVRARMGGALREKLEPDDVLQDAYLSALQSFDGFDYTDDGAFLRWMCRIIHNRIRDAHDHFNARKRQPVALPRSAPTGPVSALRRAEHQQRIEDGLAQLSPEHREVLLLRYFEGLSAEEAGQRMNRSAGAIRNLAARALVELGKQLPAAQDLI